MDSDMHSARDALALAHAQAASKQLDCTPPPHPGGGLKPTWSRTSSRTRGTLHSHSPGPGAAGPGSEAGPGGEEAGAEARSSTAPTSAS
eukprot:1223103-Rhodomonas_salina.1